MYYVYIWFYNVESRFYVLRFMCMCRMPEILYHQELVQEGYNSYIHSIRCWLMSFLFRSAEFQLRELQGFSGTPEIAGG